MKKIVYYLLMAAMLFALQGCSNEIEEEEFLPITVDRESLYGTWYLTNINGWSYVDDSHKRKSEFIKSFNYKKEFFVPLPMFALGEHRLSPQGEPYVYPIGENANDALKVWFCEYYGSYYSKPVDTVQVNYFNWKHGWDLFYKKNMKLSGNQLIYNDSIIISIVQFTDTTMTTYQKDENGAILMKYKRI